MDILLLDSPNGQHSLNSLYEIPRTTTMLDHLSVFMQDFPTPKEAIHHLWKIPSIDPTIQYLHGDAEFPTKRTWLKVIQKGNYISWPLVNVKNVKNITWVQRTQKGHIRGQRQESDLLNLKQKRKRKKNTKMINLNRSNTTSSSPSTTCHVPYTPIRLDNSCAHPAVETSTIWSSTRLTPNQHGSNQWRTKPKAISPLPTWIPSRGSVSAG